MSRVSLPFDTDDTVSQLVNEFSELTGVGCFDLAVVLGSGWQVAAEIGPPLGSVRYQDWPCFPSGQIIGHCGQMTAVRYSAWNLLFFSGRFHCYQGFSAFKASFPVQLAAAFGCPRILLTAATGGINRQFNPGDFMLVEDHMNFLGDNPLRGLAGETFVDMSSIYDLELYEHILKASPVDQKIHKGVLAAMPGPSYETPAEIRFLARIGADAVSMSTIPEAIMARYLNMKVAAVAFISNHAAGINNEILNHQDVLSCGDKHAEKFPEIIRKVVLGWQNKS